MKPKQTLSTLTAAAIFTLGSQVLAQQVGASNPQALNDDLSVPLPTTQHYVKPSPAVPVEQAPAPVLQAHAAEPMPPVQTASLRPRDPLSVTDDPTSGVVMEVPSGPNELPIGTLIKAQLLTRLSTQKTQVESHFSATLTTDVSKHGQVLLPAGTVISGRVTQVHGGSRFSGPAAIRLQPDIIKLPNGMAYELEAEVIDLDHFKSAHVNNEGTIIGNDDAKKTAATFAVTTGGGAAFGAMVEIGRAHV